MDLQSGLHRPFRKDDNIPCYINVHSNHPKHIKDNLHVMISKRISYLSSNEEVFNAEAPLYNQALAQAGYKEKIFWIPREDENDEPPKRKRSRKVIYFVPPWNDAVSTPVGRRFRDILNECFPRGTLLRKLFNKDTVKMGYSCTNNIKTFITNQNKRLLRADEDIDRSCNCRGQNIICPFNGFCLDDNLVYNCKIEEAGKPETREYIGATGNTIKERINGHNSTFRNPDLRTKSALAGYVWKLKDQGKQFNLRWGKEMNAQSYLPEMGYCNLCLSEKYKILKLHKVRKLVNKRREIFNKCRHRNKFLLKNHGIF